MRWLLLVVLLGFATDARADLWQCDREVHVVPQRGSTLVPSNARIWIAGRAPWSYTLTTALGKVTELEPTSYSGSAIELQPKLEIGEHYTLRDGNGTLLTTFLVDGGADHKPPPEPQLGAVQADHLDVIVADDTTLLRVEQRDGDRRISSESILTTGLTRNGETGCTVAVTATAPCVRLTAVDLAGNESPFIERCTSRAATPVMLVAPPEEPASRHGGLIVAFVIALVVGIFVVFAPEIDMGWLRRRTTGDDLLPAAARQLAATVTRNAVVRGIVVVAGGGVGIAAIAGPSVLFVGLGLVLVLARQVWVFSRAHRMLRLLDRGAGATLHGDHVLRVAASTESSWLVCSQRQLAIATERVLPLARALAR